MAQDSDPYPTGGQALPTPRVTRADKLLDENGRRRVETALEHVGTVAAVITVLGSFFPQVRQP